jgi:hypothetical protein
LLFFSCSCCLRSISAEDNGGAEELEEDDEDSESLNLDAQEVGGEVAICRPFQSPRSKNGHQIS